MNTHSETKVEDLPQTRSVICINEKIKKIENLVGEREFRQICLNMRKGNPEASLYCIACDSEMSLNNQCAKCENENYGIPFVETVEKTKEALSDEVNNFIEAKSFIIME